MSQQRNRRNQDMLSALEEIPPALPDIQIAEALRALTHCRLVHDARVTARRRHHRPRRTLRALFSDVLMFERKRIATGGPSHG
jgi:hypothetical protein